MTARYPAETVDPDDDDGTMQENVNDLADVVVGHRIVDVETQAVIPEGIRSTGWFSSGSALALTLDNGRRVFVADTSDCCAYTELYSVVSHLDQIDHVITGVGTTGGFERWHIYADLGDVLELEVGWSAGNPFYYGYGFQILVEDLSDGAES